MPAPTDRIISNPRRLATLQRLGILDSRPEPIFENLVEAARELCQTPIALVSLVEADRQWFKAHSGTPLTETPLDQSVCAHALVQGSMLIITDLTQDPRTADNPLVTREPFIRFYAGALLRASNDELLGTLCVIDTVVRPEGLTASQIRGLDALAKQAVATIELRSRLEARDAEMERFASAMRQSSESLSLAQQAGRVGTFELDVATNTLSPSNELVRLFGYDPELPFTTEDIIAATLPEDRHLPASRQQRQTGTATPNSEWRIRRSNDGAVRWIARRGAYVFDEAGNPTKWLGTVSDVTDRKLGEIRLAAQITLVDALRDAPSVPKAIDAAAQIVGTTLGVDRVGYSTIDLTAQTFVVEQDWVQGNTGSIVGKYPLSLFAGTIAGMEAGRASATTDVRNSPELAPDLGGYEAIGTRAQVKVPLFAGNRLVGLFFVHSRLPRVWSAEEQAFIYAVADRLYAAISQLESDTRQQLLNHEISHRLKNTLAMVNAISGQTLRGETSQDALAAFEARILALSRAHEILLQDNWASARIRAVIDGLIAVDGEASRFSTDGPDIPLGPQAALTLSMVLHEMITNAAKYGALSTPGGHVKIAWQVEGRGEDAQLKVTWDELGGPPVSPTPGRKGFGSRLIRAGLAGPGSSVVDYRPSGLHAEFSAPMHRVRDT